jgi:uncharacterized protein (TIGR02246 family)
MIRSLHLLAIGTALVSVRTPSGFGQTAGRPLAAPAQVQATPAVAPVQSRSFEASDPASSTTAAAEKSVREALVAYVGAYNQKDVAKLVELFTQDGSLVDSENQATRGREAIAQQFTEGFAEPSTYTLDGKTERIRLITPDVAQAEGMSRLVSPREATIANRFVALLARQGGAWKIAEMRDYPAPVDSVAPNERLKELEWMVGEWVDESEDSQVTSTVRWGQGKGYLVRDYSVQVKGEPTTSGLMVIAWDAQSDQIKSWIFNADGSHGEGCWTRVTENQWVIKAHGSTGDGRPTSATQVITLINKAAIKTSSIDRIVGGEITGDIEEIIMVRKPMAPGIAPSPTGTRTTPPTATPR